MRAFIWKRTKAKKRSILSISFYLIITFDSAPESGSQYARVCVCKMISKHETIKADNSHSIEMN